MSVCPPGTVTISGQLEQSEKLSFKPLPGRSLKIVSAGRAPVATSKVPSGFEGLPAAGALC